MRIENSTFLLFFVVKSFVLAFQAAEDGVEET
jgi:hypothetical protein